MKIVKYILFIFCLMHFAASSIAQQYSEVDAKIIYPADIKVGAERTDMYFPLIKGKRLGIVANQTSVVGKMHLVDSLLKAGFNVKTVFCPEHGFRGEAEAGEEIGNRIDAKTGIRIVSLYGKTKKPAKSDLDSIDIMIYDMQDVGVRFYTYISTLHYVMEACAENNIPLIVLDRPDPNGFYIDGPVLEPDCRSFVGLDPVPIVYGMTAAEYAQMLNGEGWLENAVKCRLTCIPVDKYEHSEYYQLPVKPSPNLPDMEAVYLYPSLGVFEGTVMSVGRGTDLPFQVLGHPDFKNADYTFIPQSIKGMSLNPPHKGKKCYGYNLKDYSVSYIKNTKQIYLYWLHESYTELKDKGEFFNDFFDKLAGTKELRKQVENNETEEVIRNSWKEKIAKFKNIRKKYLLYTDFE